jgi:predicted NBD/HSP70 family sugar kinase
MGLTDPRSGIAPRRDLLSMLYASIHANRQTSRVRLARSLDLSKASVTGGVATLLQLGLIREVGKESGGGARGPRQTLLEVEPRARLVLGAQIGDDSCTVVTTDVYANIEDRARVPLYGMTPADAIGALRAGVETLRRRTTIPILGLGVGVPGVADASGRKVALSLGPHWSNVPLADELESALGLPVQLANRAKVAALGEHWSRTDAGAQSLVYVHMGTGIVAGIVLNGKLLFGRDGLAGELGHTTVVADGPPCDCGNRGCLQTLASTSASLREVRTRAQSPTTLELVQRINRSSIAEGLELVSQAARDGDQLAATVLQEAATYLGIAIANLINLYNPQTVVLGGPIVRGADGIFPAITREIHLRALRAALRGLPVVASAMPGEEAGAIGAAALFLEHLPEYLSIPDTIPA